MLPTKSFTEEELRILRAAQRGTLTTNEHGRWIILDEEQLPAPKDRRRLLDRMLITWPHYRTGKTLTETGERALEALDVAPH